MPVPALISAIVSSIVTNAAEQAATEISKPAVPVVTIGAPARALPQNAIKGEMLVVGPMSAEIDGKTLPLAPGVQIRNPANLIVMPSTLQQPVPVRYLTDPMGSVFRVWILSAQEAAQY